MSSFKLPRLPNIQEQSNYNIRNSETFPRINEAENKVAKKKKPPPKSALYTESETKNVPKPMFRGFILNEDPKVAKHLPFNEVVYPNIFNDEPVDDPTATLESYYVSGIVDRGIRDGDKYEAKRRANHKRFLRNARKAKMKAAVKEKEANSPNKEKSKLGSPSKSATDSTLDEESSDLKSSSAGGSTISSKKSKMKKRNPKIAAPPTKEDIFYLHESIKKEHPTKRAKDEAVFDSAPCMEMDLTKVKTQASTFTVNDTYKLNRLEAKADKVSFKIPPMAFKPIYKKKVDNYLKTDVLPAPPVSSFEIENLFDRERVENEAATKLQRAYVHSCVVAKVRHVVKGMLAAVKIQKMFRGIITRKWTSIWVRRRTELITQWQARVRKWYVNRHNRPIIEHERQCAIKIQKIVLGKLGRLRWIKIKRNKAAERIQVMWRGVLARARSDHIWLNKSVIPIQCKARALVSKLRYKSIFDELSAAALAIQRCFRSWYSMRIIANRLTKREDAYREFTAAKLAAEEEWCEDVLVKLKSRLAKKELDSKLQTVVADYILSADEIHRKENDLIETTRQKDILSARAIEQGWVQELTAQIIDQRAALTKAKLAFCFQKVPLLRSLEEMLEDKVDEIDDMCLYRDSISFARDEEIEDNRLHYYYTNASRRRKEKKQAIAAERRKWAVRWYKSDGKPDKQRRPGRAWDPEILAGPEEMTYCPTTDVDLNAENQERISGLKRGSDESLKATVQEVSLQSYLAQVAHYETLLNPINDIMKRHMGAPSDGSAPHPKDSGWGPTGEDLPLAMENIGAVPSKWRLQREQRKREEAEAILREQQLIKEAEEQEAMDAELRRIRQMQAAKLKAQKEDGKSHDGLSVEQHVKSITENEVTQDEQEQLNKFRQEREEKKLRRLIENEAKRVEKEKAEERARIEAIRQRKRKKRIQERRRGHVSIPWALLDELEGEKKKFEAEKNYTECFHNF